MTDQTTPAQNVPAPGSPGAGERRPPLAREAGPSPAVSSPPTPPARPGGTARRSAGELARAFFGVVARRRTWLNVVYLLTSFPLGLIYFVTVVTGLGLGLGLAILWVGIPILLVVAGLWWAFAALERLLARGLLGLDCGLSPRPWENETGLLGKLRAHFTASSTWRDLAFVLLKLPLGVISFGLLVAAAGLTNVLLFAPAIDISNQADGAFDLWGWRIDSWFEALPLLPLAVLVLLIGLHLVDLLAEVWRLLADALLSEPHRGTPADPAFYATQAGAPWNAPGSSGPPPAGAPAAQPPAGGPAGPSAPPPPVGPPTTQPLPPVPAASNKEVPP